MKAPNILPAGVYTNYYVPINGLPFTGLSVRASDRIYHNTVKREFEKYGTQMDV